MIKQVAGMDEADRLAMASKMSGAITCEGRSLSLYNSCLMAVQRPDATIVGGFQQWRKQGRVVRKGEHGMMIWIPMITKNGDESAPVSPEAKTHFIIGTLFDISQTEEAKPKEG